MNQRFDYYQIAPDAVKAFGAVHSYVINCGLPSPLVELVYLRV